MKNLIFFEPAMCCSTGVCGPSVDEELLRISLVVNKLKKNEINVNRYNLSNNPQKFIDNKTINKIINNNGVQDLPVTIIDDKVVKTKKYPTNKELADWLNLDEKILQKAMQKPMVEL